MIARQLPAIIQWLQEQLSTLLEIGGMLEQGRVVAREYGKPCVAGIQGITTALHDSQLVEVNVSTGHVRLLD